MPKPTGFHEAFERELTPIAPHFLILDETGSTNDVARALARDGAPHLTTVVANVQSSGRGRLGRTWIAEPGTSLLASWVVRPAFEPDRWPVIPLLAGLAAAEAVRVRAKVEAVLKWPNDVLVEGRKLAGILVEADPPGSCVVGIGLNVSQTGFADGLAATSLALEGAVRLDRADLLAAILRAFDASLGDPAGALDRYRGACATIGSVVRVEMPGRASLEGMAEGIDESGALVVEGHVVSAGDVVHVRPP